METHTKRSSSDNGETSISTSFPLMEAPKKRTVTMENFPNLRSQRCPVRVNKKMLVDRDDLFPTSYTTSTPAPTATGTKSDRKRPCDKDDDLLEAISKSRNDLRNIQREKALMEEKEKKLLKVQEAEVEKFNKKYKGKTPWELYELFCGK